MFENDFTYLLLLLLPAVAFLYASVGHGGASSYLVLLALFGFAPAEIRPTALMLNIMVSAIAFLNFRKACVFPLKLFLSLALFSVPASFLGGLFTLDTQLYQKLLGVLLLFPILKLFNFFPSNENAAVTRQWWMAPALGFLIGLMSGLIGIGGGIILSPVLLMLGWSDVRQTAAISALFILLNSVAGLSGSGLQGFHFQPFLQILLPLTVAGGLAGAFWGAFRFNVPALKYMLALVLTIAATKFLLP